MIASAEKLKIESEGTKSPCKTSESILDASEATSIALTDMEFMALAKEGTIIPGFSMPVAELFEELDF